MSQYRFAEIKALQMVLAPAEMLPSPALHKDKTKEATVKTMTMEMDTKYFQVFFGFFGSSFISSTGLVSSLIKYRECILLNLPIFD